MKDKSRLWYSYKKTSPVLWHESSYIQYRQGYESDNTISSIHTAIHKAAMCTVSNRNSTSSYHRSEYTGRYMHLQVDRPYSSLNSETYITIRQQELRTCKRIGYEFYYEELFMVKHKSKYSCKRTIYFHLDPQIIKENYKFTFYYNKTDITPTVLDGGNEIILANWPNHEHIICSINNDIQVRIPSHL